MLRPVRATVVGMETQCSGVCVCRLTHPACNAHAPYFNLWSARLYNIFPHFLINVTIFEKKVIENKVGVLNFSTNLSETFLNLRITEPNMI
jgi:hypothetical protein